MHTDWDSFSISRGRGRRVMIHTPTELSFKMNTPCGVSFQTRPCLLHTFSISFKSIRLSNAAVTLGLLY